MNLDTEAAARTTGGNRFELVSLVRLRADKLANGAEPRVYAPVGSKPVSTALSEAIAGELHAEDPGTRKRRQGRARAEREAASFPDHASYDYGATLRSFADDVAVDVGIIPPSAR